MPRKSKAFLRRSAAAKKAWQTRRRHEREREEEKERRRKRRKKPKPEPDTEEIVGFMSEYT